MRTKTNHCLDWLKGIGCIGVVFIHVQFPGCFGDIVCRLSQFAVPVFFLTSGYFAYSEDKVCMENAVKRRVKRILWLGSWTTCVYYLFTAARTFLKDGCILGGDISGLVVGLARFFILQDVDFSGGGHLWFLWALFWCYILVLAVNRFSLWEYGYRLLPSLIVLVVIQYAFRMYYDWTWHTSTFLTAMTFVITGFFLGRNKAKICNLTNKNLLVAIVAGELVGLINLLHPRYDFSQLGIVVASISMFVYAIKNEKNVMGRFLEVIGRKYSLNIYIFHIMMNAMFNDRRAV